MSERGMRIVKTYGDWDSTTPPSERRGSLLVYSQKRNTTNEKSIDPFGPPD